MPSITDFSPTFASSSTRPTRGSRCSARVRADPNAPGPLLALAEALATAGGTVEAIELDWRAFDKTEEVGGKRAITSALAALYLSANQFDRLLDRLERLRRDRERVPEDRRVFTLCIAQAHQAAGDLGTARRELERLLAERPADVMLLQQLTSLAEKEWDLAAAWLSSGNWPRLRLEGAGSPGLAAAAAWRGGQGARDLAARGVCRAEHAAAAGSHR